MTPQPHFQMLNVRALAEHVPVPPWADYVDVVNDGGCAIDLNFGGALPRRAETGERVPIPSRELRVIADASLRAPLPATSLPILAFLSHGAALVTPAPSKKHTREFQQKEQIVQAAAARLVTYRGGIRSANLIFSTTYNGVAQAGFIYVADESAKATALLGIPLEPGDSLEEWIGPLWVFRPASATDARLDVVQQVKDLGGFA